MTDQVTASAASAPSEVLSLPIPEVTTETASTEAPVVTSAEDSTETQTTDQNSTEAQETVEQTEHKKKSGFERRVQKLNAKAETARQEAEFWKAEALKNKQPQPQSQPQSQPQQAQAPQMHNYSSMEEYTNALLEHKMAGIEAKRQIEESHNKQRSVLETYNQRAAEFSKQNPDFVDVIEDMADVHVCSEIHAMALDSDVGPALVYHLANNPDEIERINKLNPTRRLAELGKLEDRLSKASVKAPVPAPTKPAPAPVKPVTGPAAVVTTKSIYEMSPSELITHRNSVRGRR